MLDDLNGIEEELDRFLQAHGTGDRYMSKLFDQPQRDTPSTREEVFQNALKLESEIQGLTADVNKCWKAMERRDDHSSNYKSAADKYNLRGDPEKEQQVSTHK